MDSTESLDLFELCRTCGFGKISLQEGEERIFSDLNNEIINLCRSLPVSVQTDAMLFFMQYLKTRPGEPVMFFKNYYAPAWSVIHWISASPLCRRKLTGDEYTNALCAQSMAMFLHSLDDHLNDNEIPSSHMAILIRSQAWLRMIHSLSDYAKDVTGGDSMVSDLIDSYYSGITNTVIPDSFDDYCSIFKKQMATWLAVPILTAEKLTCSHAFADDIRSAYESFGIAWRLIDDINDVKKDLKSGIRSGIYYLFSEEEKNLFDELTQNSSSMEKTNRLEVLSKLINRSHIYSMLKRIADELEHAAVLVEKHELDGLAMQYRLLADPLKGITLL